MKWCKCFIVLSIIASARLVPAQTIDTLDLVGGMAGSWGIGWFGEAWLAQDSAWCNDTLKRDTSTVIETLTVLDTLTDTYVPKIDTQTTITPTIAACSVSDFTSYSDSGGFYPGAPYIKYYYKFRNYYAQLPFDWMNWQGYDSATVSPYKYLMIVYKGLLPAHQMQISFFYATWGTHYDSLRNILNLGDGVATLLPSTNWKTAVIQIPDSVYLPYITGMVFGIGNAPGLGGKTSAVGELDIARISLVAQANAVKYQANHKIALNNRYVFTPAGGNVSLTVFSLKGEVLASRDVTVQAGTRYSVRQFVFNTLGLSASQVRMVSIKGKGVNVTTRIW
jgi:hypothetical protein